MCLTPRLVGPCGAAASLCVTPRLVGPCGAAVCQVCEHHKRGFDPAALSETFGYQTLGNGLVAGQLQL